MTRAGNQRLPVFRGLALLGLGAVWAAACGGPQKQAGAGAVCFRTDDCQTELACVPEAIGSSTRVCSADASGIVSMVDGAPLEAAAPMPDAAAGGSYAGSMATPVGGANAAGATSAPSGGAGSAGAPAKGGSGGACGGGCSRQRRQWRRWRHWGRRCPCQRRQRWRRRSERRQRRHYGWRERWCHRWQRRRYCR